MNFNETVRLIRMSLYNEIPVAIAGTTGVGKSHSVHEAVRQGPIMGHNYQVRVVHLESMEETDLTGPLDSDNHSDVAKWKRVELIADYDASYEEEPPILYFLDELSRATRQVRHALMSAIYDNGGVRRLGPHRIRDLDRVVLAYNPAGTEENFDVDELCSALLARCCNVTQNGSIQEWKTFAAKKKLELTEFLLSGTPPAVTTTYAYKPIKNFRTMEMSAHAYSVWNKHKAEEKWSFEDLRNFVEGLIGSDANNLGAWLDKQTRPWDAIKILKDSTMDELLAYIKKIAPTVEDMKIDIVTQVADQMMDYMDKEELVGDEFERAGLLIEAFPRDLIARMVSVILDKTPIYVKNMKTIVEIDRFDESIFKVWNEMINATES